MSGEPAVAYARLSEDREGAAAGVGAQLEVCRAYAEAQGLMLVAELSDNDVSASRYSKADRPAYAQLLELCRTGAVGHVIVRETSRLYRRPRDLEDLIDLCEHQGIVVHAPLGGRVDLSSGSGRFHARVLAAVDAQESDRISERVRYKHEALARAGKPSGGGSRPFGLTADWSALVPAEAAIVRELAARVIGGESLWALADDLDARGVTTSTGGAWSLVPLRRVLSRHYLAGLRVHTVEVPGAGRQVAGVYPAEWPAILDLDTWEALQRALKARGKMQAPRSRAYLLTGLAWCERCDRRLDGHVWRKSPTSPDVRQYRCTHQPGRPGCGMTIAADPLEAYVAEALIARISDEGRRAARRDAQTPDLLALSDERAKLEIRRSALGAAFADGSIGLEALTAGDKALAAQVEALDRRLAEARPVLLEGLDASALTPMTELWGRANFGQRRRLVERTVGRVWVRPAVRAGRGSRPADRVRLDLLLPAPEPGVEADRT